MDIKYKFNWCDFLTPCPHGKDCCVGDFDCHTCKHFVNSIIDPCDEEPPYTPTEYKKYTEISTGTVTCNFKPY